MGQSLYAVWVRLSQSRCAFGVSPIHKGAFGAQHHKRYSTVLQQTPLLCMGSTWPNAARLESHPSLDYAAPAPLSGEPLVCAALEVRCKIGGRHLSQRVPRCQLPLKGKPRAFGAYRNNAEAVDYGGRQVTSALRKRKRSGKRFAYQVGRRMQSQACLVPRTVCGCSLDPHPRGGFLGREPPP